eukprot:6667829-Karenia_brevis.AAC.1
MASNIGDVGTHVSQISNANDDGPIAQSDAYEVPPTPVGERSDAFHDPNQQVIHDMENFLQELGVQNTFSLPVPRTAFVNIEFDPDFNFDT